MLQLNAKNSTKFSKAPRKVLSLTKEQKYLICEYKTKYPTTKMDKLAEHFEKELKLEPHSLKRTTLCGILKDSDKIMNTDFATEYRDLSKNVEKKRMS